MEDPVERCFQKVESDRDNDDCHNKSGNIFNSSMPERMLVIRRFCRHFESDQRDCRRARIREVVDRVGRDGNTSADDADCKFNRTKQQICNNSRPAGQNSVGGSNRRRHGIFMVFDKQTNQQFIHKASRLRNFVKKKQ